MVDVTEISAVVAAAGVLIGVLYYVWDMRHQEKIRKTDLVIGLFSSWESKEFAEATLKIRNLEFEDYDDFVKKYGQWDSENEVYEALHMVGSFFEFIGILLSDDLVDVNIIADTFGMTIENTWEKIKPLVEGGRKIYGSYLYHNFECLYNEMKKRVSKLQQSTA